MAGPFLVIFTARSGSTALFGELRSHPDVTMRAEVFGNAILPGEMEQNDDNRIKFLRQYWSPFAPQAPKQDDLPAKGFKFQVTFTNEQFGQPARLIKVAKEYQPKIIVLRRRNILKQSISSLNAQRLLALREKHAAADGRGSAHVTEAQKADIEAMKKERLVLDFDRLRHSLNNLKASYAQLDRYAAAFPGALEITYEDYLADPKTVTASVFKHIGVDPAAQAKGTDYVKITSDHLPDVIANFNGLERFAQNNGYTEMLTSA